MEEIRPLTGRDPALHEFVHDAVVKTLAEEMGTIGFTQLKEDLASGEFVIGHISREDGGTDWETFVYEQTMESGTGNCLDVSWL